MVTTLSTFAQQFPVENTLWAAIQASSHTEPEEQRAVARAIVKDILSSSAKHYLNAYYHEAQQQYPGRPFAAYNISLFNSMPQFAKRASKKRAKTVLGWVHSFLSEAGETELLEAFEVALSNQLPN